MIGDIQGVRLLDCDVQVLLAGVVEPPRQAMSEMKRVLLKGKILQMQLTHVQLAISSATLGRDISDCEAIITSRWSFPLMLARLCMGDRCGSIGGEGARLFAFC